MPVVTETTGQLITGQLITGLKCPTRWTERQSVYRNTRPGEAKAPRH